MVNNKYYSIIIIIIIFFFFIYQHLQNIHYWLSLKSLSINLQKFKYIIFSLRSQSYFNSLLLVNIVGTSLQRVYTYKYLGLIFNYLDPNTFRKWRKKLTKLLVWFTGTFMLIAVTYTVQNADLPTPLSIYSSVTVIWDPLIITYSHIFWWIYPANIVS